MRLLFALTSAAALILAGMVASAFAHVLQP
jgi:hypothetical protein